MTITNIVNSIYFLTNTDVNSFTAANMLLAINNAYERVASLITQVDGRWQWDDDNQTGDPSAMYTLTADTKNYAIATTILAIKRVEVKDAAGNWSLLRPIDEFDVRYESLTDFMKSSGQPAYYDKIGAQIFIYPAPNYTQANSLKIYFSRPPLLFTSAEVTTGTKVPGFNSLYHDLIPLWVAYDFALARGKENINQLRGEIQVREATLMDDYLKRSKDENIRIRTVHRSSR